MSYSRAGTGVAAVALSGLAVLGLQSAASAAPEDCPVGQTYAPGSGCTGSAAASVDHRNFSPDGAGVVHGEGFMASSEVKVYADSVIYLTTATANTAGVVDAAVTLPSLSLGAHSLVLKGMAPNGQPLTLSVPIRVVSASSTSTTSGTSGGTTTASGSSLPRTGLEVGVVAATGLALVGAGTGAVFMGRRRREIA